MKRPNVLIFLADQQRYDTLACAGFPYMHTPCLDALASDSVLYTNACSSNPVCMPARHDLLTGSTGRCHGYFSNADRPVANEGIPFLPRVMAENGYRTIAIGKMHFFPTREHHGFGEMQLMEELPVHRQDDEYATYLAKAGLESIQNLHGVRPHIYHIPQLSIQDEAHHGTAWVADRAIEWLDENGDAPFFMMCGFVHPHPPWNIPKERVGMYRVSEIPPPIPRCRFREDEPGPSQWFGDFDSPEAIRSVKEAYFTAVSMIDTHVGRVLDWLKERNRLDDTLVIYTSDHGEMLYDKGYFSKEVPYEGAVRIPLIVHYPEPISGRDERLVNLTDIYPTVLDVCGIRLPPFKGVYSGCSLRAPGQRQYQCSATGWGQHRWIMVRDKRWKYIFHYNGGLEELYDLEQDPGEEQELFECRQQFKCLHLEDMRRQALVYERTYGPTDMPPMESLPFKPFDPSVRGKYHFWQNTQMQKFDTRAERQQVLAQEMRQALRDQEHSGGQCLENLLQDARWVEQFMNCWRAYGELPVEREAIFPTEEEK